VGGPLLALAVTVCFLLTPFLGGRRAFWTIAPGYIRLTAWMFGIRRQLSGWDGLPEALRSGKSAAVFVGNHSSLFDPPLIISTLPCRPVFIAKQELARVPFLGWVIWLAGFIFIDRSRRERAVRSLADAAQRVRDGQSVAAFPEGTRSREDELLPFKKGPFALAFEARVPVVPLAIRGGARILPPGSWRVSGGAYEIRVGAPLDPAAFDSADALRGAAESALRDMLL
jgi:1-acyl-sn-glycerol-3-phosphate acyltransferase